MADLTSTGGALSGVRADQDTARDALFAATQRRSALDAEIARLRRVGADEEHGPLAAALKERDATDQLASNYQAQVQRLGAQATTLGLEFAKYSDPRDGIQSLSDKTPVLLFPVRLETRFKVITTTDGIQNQLWVRVYPDDCVIDAFEPTLSDTEVASANAFWTDWWRAGGRDTGRRAAWRDLAASHGVGRAGWIAQQIRPVNAADEYMTAVKGEVVLVIPTGTALSAEEAGFAATYWEAIWRADGTAKAQRAAADRLAHDLRSNERAAVIAQEYAPKNLSEEPPSGNARGDPKVLVKVVVLVLPPVADTKQQSWSQSPRVRVLPDRFVFLGYQDGEHFEQLGELITYPLVCGPDPSAPAKDQLQALDGDLSIPDDMKWMVDFDRAVASGLGFKIDLTPAQVRKGFIRLMVLGVRLSQDEEGGQASLQELLQHHQHSGRGLSLLSQGTPTNNTEGKSSGYSRGDDPAAGFDDFVATSGLFTAEADPLRKKDGQWLAECLGIDPEILKQTHNAGGTDQSEAKAMNAALWPATLGYFMESMMLPLLDDKAIANTKQFFTRYVSGRGAIPALRINRQPYGIVPATVFSRMRWPAASPVLAVARAAAPASVPSYRDSLYSVLKAIGDDWGKLTSGVSRLGSQGATDDAHKQLLDVIGLHPGSVEYHQRFAESLQHAYNLANLDGQGDELLNATKRLEYLDDALALLKKLGETSWDSPEVMNLFFLGSQQRLGGPVVDDKPLSETDPIRAYTPGGQGYLQWLIDATKTSLETLRTESGFLNAQPPTALLYLLLRHAVILEFWRTSVGLYQDAGAMTGDEVHALKKEPPFIHIQEQNTTSESRWRTLYSKEPRVTGVANKTVADHIVDILGAGAATDPLNELLRAFETLKDVPTARLERVFAEHIDCCTYRFDSWMLGLVHERLSDMRYPAGGDPAVAQRGIHLGAYGWLEDVRAESKVLTPVNLPPALVPIFNGSGNPPLTSDSTNAGYILAPSLNHGVTAAILRNGYLANAKETNSGSFAVNLSSTRVRLALSFLEGVRGGQSLGALLGYQLERSLHDRAGITEVERFVFGLRREFPLVADKLTSTAEADKGIPIEALEARNVVDGLALLEHVRSTGSANYPFGLQLPSATTDESTAIDAAVSGLQDIQDAIADLALAESVHQTVQGNFDRAAGVLDTYSKGNYPQEPDVIRTPRSGHLLTHRVGLHFDASASSTKSPIAGIAMTSRSAAAPELNVWLAGILPAPANLACMVSYFDLVQGTTVDVTVSQNDLGLQPIDLLYIAQMDSAQAMSALDDRIVSFIASTYGPRPDANIAIRYSERIAGKVTFFELSPLLRHLRSLVLKSRPLRGSDVAVSDEATKAQEQAVFLDRDRVSGPQGDLEALRAKCVAYGVTLKPLLDGLLGTTGQIVAQIDSLKAKAAALLESAAWFGLPQSGRGFATAWTRSQFSALLTEVEDLVDRWTGKLASFDAFKAAYAALPAATSDSDKIALLRRAEFEVSTSGATPIPLTPATLEAALGTKRANFAQRLAVFRGVLTLDTQSVKDLRDAIAAALPVDAFDSQALDFADSDKAIVLLAKDLASRISHLADDLKKRLDTVTAKLSAHDATSISIAKVDLLTASLHSLFGDEFLVVPTFEIEASQGDEWALAVNASRDDALLSHAVTLHDFPIDDWLYGVARVRDKMRDWEQVVMLGGALSATEPSLTPIQLPHQADDYWLGLEVPDQPKKYVIDGDRLLYTAHYAVTFDKTARQCGLLLDEWTEVIPAENETIGVTFHYDRPNCEAPQAMLLVTPPAFTGAWQWDDLVQAVAETFDLARKRAVEPADVDATPYAAFVPATVMATTLRSISIGTSLSLNNGLAYKAIANA